MEQTIIFEWCDECSFKRGCYSTEGKGPLFLEPACGEGPAKEGEGITEKPQAQ